MLNSNMFNLGYEGEDKEYEIDIVIHADYGWYDLKPYIVLSGSKRNNVPRFTESFKVYEQELSEPSKQISPSEAFRLMAFFAKFALKFNTVYVESSTESVWRQASWLVPIMPIMPLDVPLQASKFWARIKGFFTSAWKAIKKVVPAVAKVVSPVLPPPYGTVVAGIGTGVTVVDNAINAIATSAVKQTNSLSGMVTVTDGDVFEVTPQFRIVPYDSSMSNIVDVTTSSDNQWNEG